MVPPTTIAGAVCVPKVSASVEAAYHAACHPLETERVALVVAHARDHAFYLACPADELASFPNAVTPLAQALPGRPGHQGDGLYVLPTQEHYLVVKMDGESVETYWAADDGEVYPTLDELAAFTRLPIHRIDPNGPSAEWETIARRRERRSQYWHRLQVVAATNLGGLCLLAWVGLAAWDHTRRGADRSPRMSVHDVVAVLQPLTRPDQASQVLAHMTTIDRRLTELRGHLVTYRMRAGRIHWTAELPAYLNQDQLTGLGRVKTAAKQTTHDGRTLNLLVVTGEANP